MNENFHDHLIGNLLRQRFPSINPIRYYVWGVVKRDSLQAHKTSCTQIFCGSQDSRLNSMANLLNTHLIISCSQFRQRVQSSFKEFVYLYIQHWHSANRKEPKRVFNYDECIQIIPHFLFYWKTSERKDDIKLSNPFI